ncbi:hypothetical protein [Parasutterella sp.]|jgi:transposase InsO family protein|uniref:hypothetical protein n=1 Tax=Parasutterella sp. TaxID=2049037 RepID=UPI003522E97A
MSENYLNKLRESGLRPTRHRFIVLCVRKVLFPFLRPYLLEVIRVNNREVEALKEELSKVSFELIKVKTDLLAYKNRSDLFYKDNEDE